LKQQVHALYPNERNSEYAFLAAPQRWPHHPQYRECADRPSTAQTIHAGLRRPRLTYGSMQPRAWLLPLVCCRSWIRYALAWRGSVPCGVCALLRRAISQRAFRWCSPQKGAIIPTSPGLMT